MNKNIKKIIKITFVIFVISAILFSSIVSTDSHHLETCEVHNCSVCAMIHFAQTIINLTLAICITIIAMFLIFYFLAEILERSFTFKSNSLVFQKVQLNE